MYVTFVGCLQAQAPTEIKGVVNKYIKVNSVIDPSIITVTNTSDFAAGDTVLIAQMKGAVFSIEDPHVIDDPASMGKYEFTVINSISVLDKKITFNSPLKNIYKASESVQLIRIPSFSDVKVISELTCDPWDGEKGGILAIIASSSIELNADIDVTGKGFRGASPVVSTLGKCFPSIGVPFSIYNILNIHPDSASGRKGEGAITNGFTYSMGKGPSGNGGGAGSGMFSGGGGGGNFGIGGNGGKEICANDGDLNWGGNGGRIDGQYFSNNFLQRRIFLGGGGGSGIQKTSSSGTNGANGGGIVILLVPYLITNGFSIKANGEDVTSYVTDASSSGGGGGGGMVLLAVDSVKNNLNVNAKGGKGGGTGTSALCNGHGGGGGGGFVWFSGKTIGFSQLDLSGGDSGVGICDNISSTDGTAGDSLNRLLLPLTGFLNNLIKAEGKTCYHTRQILHGSNPQGGNGIYVFMWQYRKFGTSTWLPAPGINNSRDYITEFLADTLQFKRIVTSDGMTDISRVHTINVFPQINNNIIEPDTVLCFGSQSIIIHGSVAGGGKGNIKYKWSQRIFSGNWEAAPGIDNGQSYYIPADVSRYYRRSASSDYCSIFDSVKIEILPLISNNSISPRQTICFNDIPASFIGDNNLEGGSGSGYKYNWQQSDDSLNWINTGVINENLIGSSALTQTTYYRRIVMSGLNDCCRDTSKNIKIVVLPSIIGNIISNSQTICEETKPILFNGSAPTGGDEVFRYQWEFSKNSLDWDSLEYSGVLKDYQAGIQDTTHYFRRVIFSGLNDCCKNISNKIKITVQPKIKNNEIHGDTVICENAVPFLLKGIYPGFKGGDSVVYTPKWLQKTTNGNWIDASGISDLFYYQAPALPDTMFYQRQIYSGTCISNSNIVKIDVLKSIQGNALNGNPSVCRGFPAQTISSVNITGGDPADYRISWENSSDGVSEWKILDGEINTELQPGILSQNLYFKRNVRSGLHDCCISTSNIFKISIDERPEMPEAGTDRELVYKDTANLSASAPPVGTGIWTTSTDATIDNPDNYRTKISDLKFGRYAFYWTVKNGVCPSAMDSVILNLSDLGRYTGFSPNGDNINDVFIIEGLDNLGNKELTVLNRIGIEVFHSVNYQNEWDGTGKNGNPLPEDTYYYVLKVDDIFNLGKQRVYKGFVVIKR